MLSVELVRFERVVGALAGYGTTTTSHTDTHTNTPCVHWQRVQFDTHVMQFKA